MMSGVKTGKCVNTTQAQDDPNQKVCEIYAWCPVEIDVTPMPHFHLRQATSIQSVQYFAPNTRQAYILRLSLHPFPAK